MPYKRVLVLANSIKKGGRCVAGRETSTGESGKVGAWLRPISDAPEGELLPKHMTLEGGGQLRPLDVVDIPVTEHAGDPLHPEDWRVTDEHWRFVETCSPEMLLSLVERPPSLWLQAGRPSDRVSTEFLQALNAGQSLYLIRPQNFRLRYWREFNTFRGYVQKKTRALFNYNGVAYDMSFTDPKATAEYCGAYPTEDEPAKEITTPCGDHCVLCVSLTPPLNGTHYKVVATLLPLP